MNLQFILEKAPEVARLFQQAERLELDERKYINPQTLYSTLKGEVEQHVGWFARDPDLKTEEAYNIVNGEVLRIVDLLEKQGKLGTE